MKRIYPEQPIVAVGGILFKEEELLLVKRKNEPSKGKWSIPGGVVEIGESLEDALLREIMEETALEVEIKGLVDIYQNIKKDPQGRIRFHYVIIDYWGIIRRGKVVPSSDIEDAIFLSFWMVKDFDISQDLKKIIYRAIRCYEMGCRDLFQWGHDQ